jgi:hypothetical protein
MVKPRESMGRRVLSKAVDAYVAVTEGYRSTFGVGYDFSPQPLGRHIDTHGLAGYYCDLRHKALAASRFSDGFPRSGVRPWPDDYVIPIAQAALGYWELKLEGHDTDRQFLTLTDWLVREAVPGPAGVSWPCKFPMPKYELAPGWISAMGQGEAISVLLRAHVLTGDERYLETARAAVEPMRVEVADGGVMCRLDGHTVLEEYPAQRPTAVLNGWIFALLGVYELSTVSGHTAAQRLFEESSAGLISLLPRYDVGWWSLYSLYDHGRPDLAKPFYQRLHTVMLDALNLVRPDRRLGEMARRWERQISTPAVVRVTYDKLAFRLHRARRSVNR